MVHHIVAPIWASHTSHNCSFLSRDAALPPLSSHQFYRSSPILYRSWKSKLKRLGILNQHVDDLRLPASLRMRYLWKYYLTTWHSLKDYRGSRTARYETLGETI